MMDYQRDFIKAQYDAILSALASADGDTMVNFDAKISEPSIDDPGTHSEEKHQTHFKCSSCELESGVPAEYLRCPQCGTRTARTVFSSA